MGYSKLVEKRDRCHKERQNRGTSAQKVIRIEEHRYREEGCRLDTIVKLPIGIEDFHEIRTEDFYYVDKTGLITELLSSWGKVNLFTRPRRFGKSLNMDLLRYFFSYGCDPKLFDGLAIAKETALCKRYMGNFPVVSITLKAVDAPDFDSAKAALCSIIGGEAMRFLFLSESDHLSKEEKTRYQNLIRIDQSGQQEFNLSEETLKGSLLLLTQLLHKHYGQKAILLIDEYDVPLDKAQQYGYHDKMIDLIRNLLGRVLKTNGSLQFAVLTGCMQIAKESIFTGLNNFNVFSITNVRFSEYFGFTDDEVKTMLRYYGLEDHFGQIKEWYDGYRFGNTDVYCPWDVINHIAQLRFEPDASPKAFWINTSGNTILRTFLQKATSQTRWELECLINGGYITKKIDQELTYRDLYKDINNLWGVLFTTGYLTLRDKAADGPFQLAIPNQEIRQIFAEQIFQWFQEEARKDTPRLDAFCQAFRDGDAAAIESQFTAYLKRTISIRDTSVRKEKKENFYHGILLGLLSHRENWRIDSNAEAGEGFSDILIAIDDDAVGIVIEVKYPDNGDLEKGCMEALDQIEKKDYGDRLLQDGMMTILRYGVACYKKRCMVRMLPLLKS